MIEDKMKNSFVEILQSNINLKENIFQNNLKLDELDYELFYIKEVTFEEEAPRREALENVLGSLRIEGVNFLYLIIGDKEKISFYFGIARNKNNLKLDIDDIAKDILKSNIESNFRGSKVTRLNKFQKRDIRQKIQNFSNVAKINGVPNVNENAEKFQGIDRLVDVMLKDEFALLIIASPLNLEKIEKIEQELYNIYDKIAPYVKKSIQKSFSKSTVKNEVNSKVESESNSTNNSETISNSISKSFSTTKSTSSSNSTNNGSSSNSTSKSSSETENSSNSNTNNDNKSESVSKSISETTSKNNSLSYSDSENENETVNVEFPKKELEEWLKYIDEILLKRLNYAKGKGAFVSGVYFFANTKGKIHKLGNSFISLFSSVESNKLPLRYEIISNDKNRYKNSIYNFQLPNYQIDLNENQRQKMILFSQINGLEWFSTKELSIIASLPQKEVVGLRLKEEVEFGLNIEEIKEDINLGKIVRSGQILDADVNLHKDDLNKHIFITGVTGSGKTTTCHKLLYSSDIPFLVIEPAKTEYRVLANKDDIIVFTLGNENVAPFRLNPFEFFEGENISSRVDMIKAAIESSFDMEAAIPQIIESAIYQTYEKYGWDIATSQNYKFENPFKENIKSFPMLEDVIKEVDNVVKEQNFDERLQKDYIGSIKARLQSLIVGFKGFMLNTPRSFDFKKLLQKKVIIELEEIKNPNEKSFVMGLLLVNLNEAIKRLYKENKKFKHITLIEEAHRLLSKYEAGDSLNKKSAVESFTDMLAEVRKYGESLIIVDQIPNKLTPEVLKNTNTKIVHRIFASDDKAAIGNTMALSDEQKEFLSKLEVGRAIIFNQSFYNAVQVQIIPLENISTTSEDEVSELKLKEMWLKFILNDLELDEEEINIFFEISKLWDIFSKILDIESEKYKVFYKKLNNLLNNEISIDKIAQLLEKRFYNNKKEILVEVLNDIKNNEKLGLKFKKIRR